MSSRFSMDEIRGRKMVNNASGCVEGLVEEGDQLSIIIHERKSYSAGNEWMEEKLRSLEKIHEAKVKEDQKPRIRRIPGVLRGHKNMEKYYAPGAISIGPIHHGDPRLKETEDLKLQLTMLFIIEHNIQKEDLYKKIELNINNLRSRYVEEDIKSYNNQELTWIFLVDGCSTLHYIDSFIKGDRLDDWKIKQDHLLFFTKDIFLLENQLPFELLQLLMDSCTNRKSEPLMKSIYIYIDYVVLASRNLLHSTAALQHAATTYEDDKKSTSTSPTHLLDLLRNRLLHDSSLTESDQERKNTASESLKLDKWPNFRSASKLKEVGIKIKPSKTSSIKDICFERKMFTGILYLPTLGVDGLTGPQFMNLIAYEMCSDFYNDLSVTSYLSFMDTLINLPNDVKILLDARVLLNYFGSEEGVAELFKSFGTSGAMANNPIYIKVQYEIQSYYDRTARMATWITEGIHDYFGTPWKAMATIAVVLGLAMSFIQTFYAVKEKK